MTAGFAAVGPDETLVRARRPLNGRGAATLAVVHETGAFPELSPPGVAR